MSDLVKQARRIRADLKPMVKRRVRTPAPQDQAVLDRSLEDAAKISRRLTRMPMAHNAALTAMKLAHQLRALGGRWKEEY